jgi:hypothetical protein
LFYLIVMFVRLTVWFFMLSLWLIWAIVALPIALIASITGNDRAAHQWMRSLRWRRLF